MRAVTGERIAGLDTWRVIFAAWVVFGHLGFVPLSLFNHSALVHSVVGCMFCGVAAVMGFFIISGFCIHLPFARGREMAVGPYFLRRWLRTGLPLLGVVLLGAAVHNFAFFAVLWSLVCEEIYYAVYPLLLMARRKWGWAPIFAVSVTAATGVFFAVSHAAGFGSAGYALTWLFALPVWLLGCVLAENCHRIPDWRGPKAAIWIPRLSIWVLSSIALVLNFHTRIDYMFTMPPLAVAIYFWLQREIAYFREYPPYPVLERFGQASYTLYLVHKFGPVLAALAGLKIATTLGWTAEMVIVAAAWFLFYRLVEAPSHALARRVGRSPAPAVKLEPSVYLAIL